MLAQAGAAEDRYGRGSGKRLAHGAAVVPDPVASVLIGPVRARGSCFINPRRSLISIERFNHASAIANQRACTSGSVHWLAIARHAS